MHMYSWHGHMYRVCLQWSPGSSQNARRGRPDPSSILLVRSPVDAFWNGDDCGYEDETMTDDAADGYAEEPKAGTTNVKMQVEA